MPPRIIGPGRSCLECRRRKIRCNRSHPCAYCVGASVTCKYPDTNIERSRATRSHNDEPAAIGTTDIEARIHIVECQVQSLVQRLDGVIQGLQVSSLATPNSSEKDVSSQNGTEHSLRRSDWSGQTLGDGQALSPIGRGRSNWSSSIFSQTSRQSSLESLYPSRGDVAFLWQTYLTVVDPLFKFFHAPTIQQQVMNIIHRGPCEGGLPECLMFAICYAAVIAISTTECERELKQNKAALLERYRTGVEQALEKAEFLTSKDIVVLQALILYLTCGRRDEHGPDVAKLTGLAVGNAMRLGIHRDGADLGLSQFQVEMRRRLWWQLYTLDTRIAEDYGTEPIILETSFNTELPSNTNEANLDPDMAQLLQRPLGKTDMTFSLLRSRISHLARQILFPDQSQANHPHQVLSQAQKSTMIDQFAQLIEDEYLQYCDKTIPLDFVVITASRLILAKLKVAVSKPRLDPDSTNPIRPGRHCYQKSCIELLQHAQMLREYKRGRRWMWLFQTYVEWDALAYLLLELCLSPSTEIADVAWKYVDEVYSHWKTNQEVQRDHRWTHIENLYSEALEIRLQQPGFAHRPETVATSTDRLPRNLNISETIANDENADISPANPDQLPGAETLCAWSEGLIERYWQVTGAEQGPISWS